MEKRPYVKVVIEEYATWVEIGSSSNDAQVDRAMLLLASQACRDLAGVRLQVQDTGSAQTLEGVWTQQLLPGTPSASEEQATRLHSSSRSSETGPKRKRTPIRRRS